MRTVIVPSLAALAVSGLALAAPLTAQTPTPDFRWTGRVATGKTLEVKGVNGWIRATAASGNQIEVTAVKRAQRSDPEEVKVEVLEHGGGVTICAVYPTPSRSRHENSCGAGDDGHMNTEDNDVKVDFTVRVPAGVEFMGHTVNGDVEADGLTADAHVATVNGDVNVTTRGKAEASTVNGSITATVGRADWEGELSFSTVNGSITLYLPDNLSTEVEASTVNGDLITDFPLTVSGRFGPRRMRGTIGQGGRSLELSSVNGSIKLKKKGAA